MIITPAPATTILPALLARDATTWGYIDGDSNSPITCPAGYPLTYAGARSNFIGCCNQVSCADPAYRLCVPADSPQCANDEDICSNVYTSYLSCTGSLPACVTYSLLSVVDQSEGVTSYSCAASSALIKALVTSTDGSGGSSPSSAGGDSGGAGTSSAAGDTSGSSGGQSTSGGSTSSGYSESDKIALGVGIGFGIPATIGAIAGVVVCLRRRGS